MGESFLAYPLALGLFLAGMVMKPSRFRWILWPIMASQVYSIFFKNPLNDPPTDAALRSSFVTFLLAASDYILLTDVQTEFRREGQTKAISTAPFRARLHWALQLFFGHRGVGWAHEPKGILPPRPRLTRGRFILSQASWLVAYLLLIDATEFMIAYTSIFARDTIPTISQPWHWRFLGTFLMGIRGAVYITITHTVLSIVSVATWTSEPKGWPHLFGKWGDAYTVRKFWGRTWHQTLRRIVSSHGKYAARALNLPAGSNSSSYVQLYTAFLLSGVIHTHPSDMRPLSFFMSQALGITLEDAVIAAATKAGYKSPTRMHKILGYIWVFYWFTYSLPGWMDSLIEWGMLEPQINLGITSGLLRNIGLLQT